MNTLDSYLLIDTTGELRWIQLHPTQLIDQMYDWICCDCVELVRTKLPGIVIMVDESGKVKDPPQEINPVASTLYAGADFGDYIHGPAIVCALIDNDLAPLRPVDLAYLSLFLGVPIPEHK